MGCKKEGGGHPVGHFTKVVKSAGKPKGNPMDHFTKVVKSEVK